MNTSGVRPALHAALLSLRNTPFTVGEATDAYVKQPGTRHTSKKAARQFVYRNFQRLISRGLMARILAKGAYPRYQLASDKPSSATEQIAVHTRDQALQKSDTCARLKEKLAQCKLEMLAAIGETEAYDDVCEELPMLRQETQPLYDLAREKSSKLLGRAKALESLLRQQCAPQ